MANKESKFERLRNFTKISNTKGDMKLGIKQKLLFSSLSVFLIMAIIIGSVSILTSYRSTESTVQKILSETVQVTSERISRRLDMYKVLATEISTNDAFVNVTSNESEDKEKMIGEMNKEVKRIYDTHADVTDMIVMGTDGKDLITGLDLSDRQYFKDTMDKKQAITNDVVISKEDGKAILTTTAPIMMDGKIQGVVGIIIDAKVLSTIAADVEVGDTGKSFILNSQGTDIGDSNEQLVQEEYNVIEKAKQDKSLQSLAEIHSDMVSGNTGMKEYKDSQGEIFLGYSPITNTNGWSVGISVDKDEFMKASIDGAKVIILCVILCLALGVVITLKSANSIVNPIIACVERIKGLSQGDLSSPVPMSNTNDEIQELAEATSDLVQHISEIIYDIDNVLSSISQGDLTVEANADYVGEFVSIKNSSDNIMKSLNEVMEEISLASSQVASGANQVSIGAQSLSQGSTEQAASVEELLATIIEISNKTNNTSKDANQINKIVNEAVEKIQESNEKMKEMMSSIELINLKSNEISKIIKIIDDIAFQTNILALNAAVEAARAGEAGKGFAVVADEVRNLSVKSADAAKNTTILIEETVKSINIGSQMAKGTEEYLEQLDRYADLITERIDNISNDLLEQSISVNQITQSIEMVSTVVQSNSAASEESAAASEELTGQSYTMNELISRFKLSSGNKESNNYDDYSNELSC